MTIPFDPIPLNGYLFRPARDDPSPRPTVLFPGGFDGTCEEMYKYGAHAALAMGWNALTWDGPGRGPSSSSTAWPCARTSRGSRPP